MKVLCVGSCTIDTLIKKNGNITFSDKSITHIKADEIYDLWGGCAPNVSLGLKQLKVSVSLFSAPPKNKEYLEYLKKSKVTLFLEGEPEDFRFYAILDNSGHKSTIFKVDNGIVKAPSKKIIKAHDLVIISSANKKSILKAADNCAILSKPYILDIGNTIFEFEKEEFIKIHKSSFINTMNQKELNFVEKEFKISLIGLSGNNKQVIITRGEYGADWYFNKKNFHSDILYTKPVDETGCGDAFRVGLIYGLTHNMNKKTCLNLGMFLAYKNVQVFGGQSYTVTKDEMLKFSML